MYNGLKRNMGTSNEIEMRGFWKDGSGKKLVKDLEEHGRRVRDGVVVLSGGRVESVKLVRASGEEVKTDLEKLLLLRGLLDDLVKEMEADREFFRGI